MIRYRRDGYNIVVSSNNLEEAKRKFIEKLQVADELKRQQECPRPLTDLQTTILGNSISAK